MRFNLRRLNPSSITALQLRVITPLPSHSLVEPVTYGSAFIVKVDIVEARVFQS